MKDISKIFKEIKFEVSLVGVTVEKMLPDTIIYETCETNFRFHVKY